MTDGDIAAVLIVAIIWGGVVAMAYLATRT